MRSQEGQPTVQEIPIEWKYAGNFATSISLNTAILRQLVEIIGAPQSTLIIRDGKESIERTGIRIVNFSEFRMGASIDVSDPKEEVRMFTEENDGRKQTILEINSQVIDGRIRDLSNQVITENGGYKKIFLETIDIIVQEGIWAWAFQEMHEKGMKDIFKIFKNAGKKDKIRKFLVTHGSHILLRESHARGNHE